MKPPKNLLLFGIIVWFMPSCACQESSAQTTAASTVHTGGFIQEVDPSAESPVTTTPESSVTKTAGSLQCPTCSPTDCSLPSENATTAETENQECNRCRSRMSLMRQTLQLSASYSRHFITETCETHSAKDECVAFAESIVQLATDVPLVLVEEKSCTALGICRDENVDPCSSCMAMVAKASVLATTIHAPVNTLATKACFALLQNEDICKKAAETEKCIFEVFQPKSETEQHNLCQKQCEETVSPDNDS